MDDGKNVFLQGTGLPPATHRLAKASMVMAALTVLGWVFAFLWIGFAALHLLFPAVLVTGHLAVRRIRQQPRKYKGEEMAKLALAIGYFNLAIASLIVVQILRTLG